ncbi:MAG TPA: helix-turn-helix domain-containing protein [Pyrinomonadaceae bacterium]|jgi:excisionase family DNA binding protein|nr:helix-turn-helix domain-containing protein [Pyrinomonadaceae bacterium]
MESEKLLTVAEAAQLLSIKPRTIYAWVAERRIPFSKAGRLLRFDRSELLAWAAAQGEENSQPDYLRMIS